MAVGVLGLVLTLVTPLLAARCWTCCWRSNITISLLLLMVTMNAARARRSSATFPTILLFATLFRLGLNVASRA